MGFTSFFKRGDKSAAAAKPVNDSQDGVQHLRVRARRRLIGAAVLVVIGVIGFPLLFETQPRPIPVDLPIDIPRKEGAAPLNVPAPVLPSVSASKAAAGAEVIEGTEKVIEPQAKPVEVPPAVVAPKVAEVKPEQKPETKPEAKPQAKVETKPADKAKAGRDDAARAQAILEGKSVEKSADKIAGADKGRFVVQVGAFSDNSAAREARMKVEKLGLKTYVQAVDAGGKHVIRVRIGPFSDRGEADKAAAKLKSTGLATAVLTL
ncbi:SPOR domain-containing protein [Burkholderiaceae bacterium UC74_6]